MIARVLAFLFPYRLPPVMPVMLVAQNMVTAKPLSALSADRPSTISLRGVVWVVLVFLLAAFWLCVCLEAGAR